MSMELEGEDIFSHTIQMLLVDDHEKKNHQGNKKKPLIQMVPRPYRDVSIVSFVPRVVSIGPLHRFNEDLRRFQDSKMKYLNDLLDRVPDSPKQQTLKTCLLKVAESIDQVRDCYADRETIMDCIDNAELAEMMVVDACFILEHILRCLQFEGITSRNARLSYDLVLLENQIPFFVVVDIFECTIMKFLPQHSQKKETLKNFMLQFLNLLNLFEQKLNIDHIDIHDIDHILGFLHRCYRPAATHDQGDNAGEELEIGPVRVKSHTAQELADRGGVNFKPNQNADWPLEIKVESSRFLSISWCFGMPTVKMPLLHINSFTELILRNLIAYEACSGFPSYVVSYASFMDMLVNTKHDIANLVEWDVMHNGLDSNREAAYMINNIIKEVALVDSSYFKQLRYLENYYNNIGYWPRNIVKLRRIYFSSPWNSIALVAATILFVLTVIQTVFSIKAV